RRWVRPDAADSSCPGCSHSSMIIHKVDVQRFAVLEAKNDPPIRPDRHRPKTLEIAFQRMQHERGQSQRVNRLRGMKHGQNLLDLAHVLRTDTLGIVILEKLPQALVPK